jgi:hypothetical protein
MMEHLITDRTAADVDAIRILTDSIKAGTATAEQVREYLDVTHKGAYTYRDLNRVEAAVMYVAERLQEAGYLQDLPTTATWAVGDKPNADDFKRYLGNVAMIRNALPIWESTPYAPTSMSGFDFTKANALEKILVDVELILEYIKLTWFYLGEVYSAEV